jgi:6-phosphogluconolactonase
MAQNFNWHSFADREALASALADTIAGRLSGAIERRGAALLAVSGGSTPGRLFEILSSMEIAWDKVTVTLVDERFVPPFSPRANAALVTGRLLQGRAATARFVPLFRDNESPEQAAVESGLQIASLPLPFDAVILGMGTDGHTASFFPDAAELPSLLDPSNHTTLAAVHAASAGEPRLTLTLARIIEAAFLALHIEGEEKRGVFDRALVDGERLPIRAVLDAAPRPVEVYWAP